MAVDVIPISEAKKNLSAVVSEVEKEKKVYCIARNSRAVAMLVGIKGYNRLLEQLEDLEDVRDMLEAQKEPKKPFEGDKREPKRKESGFKTYKIGVVGNLSRKELYSER